MDESGLSGRRAGGDAESANMILRPCVSSAATCVAGTGFELNFGSVLCRWIEGRCEPPLFVLVGDLGAEMACELLDADVGGSSVCDAAVDGQSIIGADVLSVGRGPGRLVGRGVLELLAMACSLLSLANQAGRAELPTLRLLLVLPSLFD
jgi:hypothetical protein